MSRRPNFQPIWRVFEDLVARRFGAATPIDKETGYASAAGVIARAARHLSPNVGTKFPAVIYETDFCHRDGEWRPYRDVLTGVPREEEFLREVKSFFEDFCRSGELTLAGVEEPRTAARRFSPINYFTLSDNVRIDVRHGDLYREDRLGGGWTLISSELMICPSAHFNALAGTLNGEPCPTLIARSETVRQDANRTPNQPVRQTNTSGGQHRCEQWLSEYAAAYERGSSGHRPRSQLEVDAVKKFGISKKAFGRAWANVAESHPSLTKQGRRSANR